MPAGQLGIWKEIPGINGDRIVLLDWSNESPKFRNLLRLTSDRSKVWTVHPSHPLEGVYTDVSFDGDVLIAYNFAGYADTIDYQTGNIINRAFVK